MAPDPKGLGIRVTGLVQGVGFRPFVWNLANREGITGRVLNDGHGVLIEAFGPPASLENFVRKLSADAPPLARVDRVDPSPLPEEAEVPASFEIAKSEHGGISTGIVPDAATCPECLEEILDPENRRYRYPFTNCTHCGPRLSIVEEIPYDRATTSMRAFTMCPSCQAEYENPADRRFHAQPNACPDCGPRLWLEDKDGGEIETGDPLVSAATLLADGKILAIKGIGGFHLACDATSEAAVSELRKRKRRDSKPLAVMVVDTAMAGRYADITPEDAASLRSAAAPIVLVNATGGLASGIASGHDRIGLMLSYTPLHYLLLRKVKRPLVMTSGNLSSEPQVTANEAARQKLAGICDGFIMHDREIVNRLDDSVVRNDSFGPAILRRGRGMAPAPLPLPGGFETGGNILAMGGDLKTAFCLLDGQKAILSQHMGDLEEEQTQADFRKFLALYRDLFRFEPEWIAADLHDGYFSTRMARKLVTDTFPDAELVLIQHHHAHLAACLMENGFAPGEEQAIGIILDGTGAGTDGTVWGGEILLGGYSGFERIAHFQPVALPGGNRASIEPWRNTVAHLKTAFGEDWQNQLSSALPGWLSGIKNISVIETMIERGINAPLSSSAGRLFDAVAALLGVCSEKQSYEGQTGMELETLARPFAGSEGAYPAEVSTGETRVISWAPMWRELLSDLKNGVETGRIAARFHNCLIENLAGIAIEAAAKSGIRHVALSGGVLQNSILAEGLYEKLKTAGLSPLVHSLVPANDGGLALGQVAICSQIAEK